MFVETTVKQKCGHFWTTMYMCIILFGLHYTNNVLVVSKRINIVLSERFEPPCTDTCEWFLRQRNDATL